MSIRKEIVFSAKDTGVADTMQRLRQSANELGRDLIRDARDFTTSGKESVRYIEEQIKAMERRNKVSQAERKFEIDESRNQGMGAAKTNAARAAVDKQYKSDLGDLKSESRQDEMQLALLRELIDTVKNTAREEIGEDRKNISRQISSDKSLDQLGIGGQDEIEAFKKTLQREEIGTISEQEREEKSKFGDRAQKATDATASALGSKNEIYAVAGALALIPLVGGGLSMLAEKALSGAEARSDARAKASGTRGQGVGLMGGANAYGMTMAEATAQYGNAQDTGSARSLGMIGGLNAGTLGRFGASGAQEAMALHQGMGIDPGALNQLGGFFGYGGGQHVGEGARQSTGGSAFDMLTKSFADTGLLGDKGQQTVNMPTIMNQTAQVLGMLSGSLDKFDPAQAMASMAKLTRLGGSFADPEKMSERYGQLHQGLTDQSNPFAQAIKFSTMQGMTGGMSKNRFELMEMQERGMTEPGMMKGYMQKLSELSGGNKDIFLEEVKAAFPALSYSNTRTLVEGYMKDPSTFDANYEQMTKGTKSLGDRNFTEYMAQSTAEWSETFADVGEELVGAMKIVGEAINSLIGYIK